MPDEKDDRKDRDRGRDGRGAREDKPTEIALAYVLELVARFFGRGIAELIPAPLLAQVKGMARGGDLTSSLRTMATAATFFAPDEEIRGVVKGVLNGVADRVQSMKPEDAANELKNLKQEDPIFAKLVSLAKSGKLETAPRSLPFAEALTYLDDVQARKIYELLDELRNLPPGPGDAPGAYMAAMFTPRELQGIANMVAERRATPNLAKDLRSRFAPKPSAPAQTVSDAMKAVQRIREELRKATETPSGTEVAPWSSRVNDGTTAALSGMDRSEQVRRRLAGQAPPAKLSLLERARNFFSPKPPTPPVGGGGATGGGGTPPP